MFRMTSVGTRRLGVHESDSDYSWMVADGGHPVAKVAELTDFVRTLGLLPSRPSTWYITANKPDNHPPGHGFRVVSDTSFDFLESRYIHALTHSTIMDRSTLKTALFDLRPDLSVSRLKSIYHDLVGIPSTMQVERHLQDPRDRVRWNSLLDEKLNSTLEAIRTGDVDRMKIYMSATVVVP
jgi:hypothetical protein